MLSILRYGNEVRPANYYFEGISAEPKRTPLHSLPSWSSE
jgi:hypothetical protein